MKWVNSANFSQWCTNSNALYFYSVTSWASSCICMQIPQLWSPYRWRFVRVWAGQYRWPAVFCVLTLHGCCGMSGVWDRACCTRATSTQVMRLSTQCVAWPVTAMESTPATSSMRLEPAAAPSWSLVRVLFCLLGAHIYSWAITLSCVWWCPLVRDWAFKCVFEEQSDVQLGNHLAWLP